MRHVTRSLATASVLLVAIVARADGGPTVHEHVPDLGADEGSLLVSSGGAQPDAIVYQGEVLPAPETRAREAGEPAMRADGGDGREREEEGRRSPSFRPDRVTELNGTVGYYTVFTPSIAPFKRVTALDAVELSADGVPMLAIADRTRTPIPVEGTGAPPPDDRPRDSFWGRVVLDFSEGRTVPFPSVAPQSRVLTVQTEPVTELRFEKDAADNFYVTSVGAYQGEVSVVFLMDAPRDYFAQPVPPGFLEPDGARATGVPASVRADAMTFAGELGLSRRSGFTHALSVLAEHFRSFEESRRPPEDTGNIYLDLSRGRRGICRHRAYGFVITALALGIHARFVQNEAHAWVEVELPQGEGWLRVDLGGAATGLEQHGGDDGPAYRTSEPDPLPRPREYERAYEEARRMSQAREREASPGASASAGGGAGEGAEGGTGGGEAGVGGGAASPPSRPGEAPRGLLELALDRQRFEVFRGQEMDVAGVARGGGGGVAGLRVEVLLRSPQREWLLGVTVTRDGGRFRGVFGVPPDLGVGDYRLLVRSPGDERWAPAVAR